MARVTGEKVKKHMKKRTVQYTDEKIGEIELIDDFLPEPKDLVLKEETVKITLSLTKESIAFFKTQAQVHHTQYQKMIRALLDQCVAHHLSLRKKLHKKR